VLTVIAWSVVGGLLAGLIAMAVYSNRFTKNVSDFLVAGRAGGRYMMTMASGMVWIGAINVVAMFELYYNAGFNAMWWVMLTTPLSLYICITGWGVYRFRETRALTVAQFLEMRYDKKTRVIAGILAWCAGLINFGLFPAVGARFFMAFCGFPLKFVFMGMTIHTFPLIMFFLLGISLFFVFMGGQIAVMVTDCLQGMFTQIAAVLIVGILLFTPFIWDKIVYVLQHVGNPAEGMSMINPLEASNQAGGFTAWFFIINIICYFFTILSNLQSQSYIASAKTAHEFRIGATLNQWRWQALLVFFMVLVLCAMVVMNHPDNAAQASEINARLNELVAGQPTQGARDALRGQLIVTSALPYILPAGFAGVFCAIMLAALISTYDSFMHTWGSVFFQDIVMPFRKKPFSNRAHMNLLRLAVLGVAVFAFVFSLLYPNPENILMYFALVNNVWLGGSAAVIIGGLYWKRGTTSAALTGMATGALMGLFGIFNSLYWERLFGHKFPINPQWWFFITIMAGNTVYIVVSLLSNKSFNMDKLLHRGKYRVESDHDHVVEDVKVPWHKKMFGITPEFDRHDRFIAYLIVGWFVFWLGVFCVGMIYAKIFHPGDEVWTKFWLIYLIILFVMAVVTTVWFTIGSIRDIRNMFASLKTQMRNDADDGFVREEERDGADA
jgi:SSS family solute:Na+ symporter